MEQRKNQAIRKCNWHISTFVVDMKHYSFCLLLQWSCTHWLIEIDFANTVMSVSPWKRQLKTFLLGLDLSVWVQVRFWTTRKKIRFKTNFHFRKSKGISILLKENDHANSLCWRKKWHSWSMARGLLIHQWQDVRKGKWNSAAALNTQLQLSWEWISGWECAVLLWMQKEPPTRLYHLHSYRRYLENNTDTTVRYVTCRSETPK